MPGGRLLGYAEYGDPAGAPIIYFHGFMGSRLDWKYFVGGISKTSTKACRRRFSDVPVARHNSPTVG